MFLWLTSPAPPTYCGGGARVFDSPPFFDVSLPDASDNRTLISHTCRPLGGINRFLNVRSAQLGGHGLPVVTLGKEGEPIFLDKAGEPILGARPILHTPVPPKLMMRAPIVQQFMIGTRPIFIDPFGNAIEIEQG